MAAQIGGLWSEGRYLLHGGEGEGGRGKDTLCVYVCVMKKRVAMEGGDCGRRG